MPSNDLKLVDPLMKEADINAIIIKPEPKYDISKYFSAALLAASLAFSYEIRKNAATLINSQDIINRTTSSVVSTKYIESRNKE